MDLLIQLSANELSIDDHFIPNPYCPSEMIMMMVIGNQEITIIIIIIIILNNNFFFLQFFNLSISINLFVGFTIIYEIRVI